MFFAIFLYLLDAIDRNLYIPLHDGTIDF